MKTLHLTLFLLTSTIVITSVSTTNAFAYSGNIPTHHSIAKPTGCIVAPSPLINWSNCRMAHTEIHFADMTGANLSKMIAKNGLFYNVNLSGANLQNSILTGSNFAYSNLSSADLRGAIFDGTNLKGADLRNSDITGGSFADAVLTGANLGGLDYSGADMSCYGHPVCHG